MDVISFNLASTCLKRLPKKVTSAIVLKKESIPIRDKKRKEKNSIKYESAIEKDLNIL